MNKFWNWIRDDGGGRVLRLEGPIDNESFWGTEITPQDFRDELEAEKGDVTVWINSPGGNVFAAAEIYTMLKEYKGEVTVKIASIAASAASVIAMAGSKVLMSPTALLMIHDPSTIAMGNTKDMEKAIETLNEVKESIINAYSAKTGMNSKKAVELGFADEVLFDGKEPEPEGEPEEDAEPVAVTAQMYSGRLMDQAILNRLRVNDAAGEEPPAPELAVPTIGMDGKTADGAVPYQILINQLEFLR